MDEERAEQIEAFRKLIASGRLREGMTRREVKSLLGDPDDVGCTSRRYRTPSCYRYGWIQLFFGPRFPDGLQTVFSEDEHGQDGVLLPLQQMSEAESTGDAGRGAAMNSYARVRRFLAETLGIDEDEILPHSRLADLFSRRRTLTAKPDEPLVPLMASFVEELGADSLDMVEFTMALEEASYIEVPDRLAESDEAWQLFFKRITVQDLADHVERGRLPD